MVGFPLISPVNELKDRPLGKVGENEKVISLSVEKAFVEDVE